MMLILIMVSKFESKNESIEFDDVNIWKKMKKKLASISAMQWFMKLYYFNFYKSRVSFFPKHCRALKAIFISIFYVLK